MDTVAQAFVLGIRACVGLFSSRLEGIHAFAEDIISQQWLELPAVHKRQSPAEGRGLNWEQSAKVFSRCSMKMRTLVDIRRLAGRTARIGTVRSYGVRRRTTVPSLSSAAKSHAGAWAIPRCSRTPIRICSMSLVRKTPVAITRFASCPEPKLHGCTEPRSTKTTARKCLSSCGDSGAPKRVRY